MQAIHNSGDRKSFLISALQPCLLTVAYSNPLSKRPETPERIGDEGDPKVDDIMTYPIKSCGLYPGLQNKSRALIILELK